MLHRTIYYIGRPEGPYYGPRQGTRPTGKDIRDTRACLRHYTTAEPADQLVIQGAFLLSRLWARVLFDSGASHSFIAASVVVELGLEVEALEEPLYVSSPLRIRARIGMICPSYEFEISGIPLTLDLRVIDISEFDVILGMDWLTAYRVVIDCECRRVTTYT